MTAKKQFRSSLLRKYGIEDRPFTVVSPETRPAVTLTAKAIPAILNGELADMQAARRNHRALLQTNAPTDLDPQNDEARNG